MSTVWQTYYKIVTMSNLALDVDKNGNGNPFNLAVNGDDYKHNYKRQVAEYHFCRAWAYFNLIKIFAPPYNQSGNNNALSIPLKETAAY